jgi:hypothetical protein
LKKGRFVFLNNNLPSCLTADVGAGRAFCETALGAAQIARPMSLTREIARSGTSIRAPFAPEKLAAGTSRKPLLRTGGNASVKVIQ